MIAASSLSLDQFRGIFNCMPDKVPHIKFGIFDRAGSESRFSVSVSVDSPLFPDIKSLEVATCFPRFDIDEYEKQSFYRATNVPKALVFSMLSDSAKLPYGEMKWNAQIIECTWVFEIKEDIQTASSSSSSSPDKAEGDCLLRSRHTSTSLSSSSSPSSPAKVEGECLLRSRHTSTPLSSSSAPSSAGDRQTPSSLPSSPSASVLSSPLVAIGRKSAVPQMVSSPFSCSGHKRSRVSVKEETGRMPPILLILTQYVVIVKPAWRAVGRAKLLQLIKEKLPLLREVIAVCKRAEIPLEFRNLMPGDDLFDF